MIDNKANNNKFLLHVKKKFAKKLKIQFNEDFSFLPFFKHPYTEEDTSIEIILNNLVKFPIKYKEKTYNVFIKDNVRKYLLKNYELEMNQLSELKTYNIEKSDIEFFIKPEISFEEYYSKILNEMLNNKISFYPIVLSETEDFIILENLDNLPVVTPQTISKYYNKIRTILEQFEFADIAPYLNTYDLKIRENGELVWDESLEYSYCIRRNVVMHCPMDLNQSHVEYIFNLTNKYSSISDLVDKKYSELSNIKPSQSCGLMGYKKIRVNNLNLKSQIAKLFEI